MVFAIVGSINSVMRQMSAAMRRGCVETAGGERVRVDDCTGCQSQEGRGIQPHPKGTRVQRNMETMTFDSAACLMKHLEVVGAKVDPRTESGKGTQDEKELYNLRQYLQTLATNGLLQFPLIVEKGERPDFLLKISDADPWGLEITEATTQAWQKKLTRLAGDTEHLHPLGRDCRLGVGPEFQTCAAVLRAMRRKAEKIRRGGYRPASRYDLLIYVNVRAFFYDPDELADMLGERVSRKPAQWAALGDVYVITASHLLLNVTKDLRRLPLFGLFEEL